MRSYSSGLRPCRSSTCGSRSSCGVSNAFTMDSRMTRPSTPPSAGSQARSGCGIMPTTLRRSLQMPAMAFTEPFGFASSTNLARRPSRIGTRPAGSLRARCDHVGRREVVAFAVADRNPQHLAGAARRR